MNFIFCKLKNLKKHEFHFFASLKNIKKHSTSDAIQASLHTATEINTRRIRDAWRFESNLRESGRSSGAHQRSKAESRKFYVHTSNVR